MRIVLDTNVIISRFLTPHGRVADIVDLWEQGAFELLTSEAILREYARVLRYPRLVATHHLTDNQLNEIDHSFREFTEVIEVAETPPVIAEDPDDDHMLACAVAGAADCIVSGDPHLHKLRTWQGIEIMKPAEFLNRFFPG